MKRSQNFNVTQIHSLSFYFYHYLILSNVLIVSFSLKNNFIEEKYLVIKKQIESSDRLFYSSDELDAHYHHFS